MKEKGVESGLWLVPSRLWFMSDFAFPSDLYSLWVLMGLPCQAIHVVGSWVFVCVFLYCCHVFFFFFLFFSWSGVISLQNPLHTIRTRLPVLLLEISRVSDAVSDFAAATTMVDHTWLLLPCTTES